MNEPRAERLRRTVAALDDVATDGIACPTAERLRASACGELDLVRNEAVILHLGACGACAASWRVARELARPQPSSWRRHAPLAAAAALLLVAIGATAVLVLREPSAAPVFRNQQVERLAALPGLEALPREDFELRWSAEPEGTTYQVVVTRDDLESLHRAAGLTEATHRVPPEALTGLPPGTRLLWQVTAYRPDGRTVVSETYVTTLE